MPVNLQKSGKMLVGPKRAIEFAVLLVSAVAAFIGSIAYQAHVARPSAIALQPLTLRDNRAPESTTVDAPVLARTSAHPEGAAEAAAPSAAPPRISVSVPTSDAHQDTGGTPLPVTVSVRDRRGVGLIDAILYNSSADPLDLMLESSNPSTGSASRVTLRLDPAESRHVGRDEGLFLNAGETLTVSSPLYQDLRTEVR
jgi:hypothetical protein